MPVQEDNWALDRPARTKDHSISVQSLGKARVLVKGCSGCTASKAIPDKKKKSDRQKGYLLGSGFCPSDLKNPLIKST